MLPCPPVHWKPSSRLVLLVPNQSSSSSSATMSSAAAAAGVVGCSVATTCPCRWSHPDEAEAEAAAEVVVAAGVVAGVAAPGAALPMTGVIAVVVGVIVGAIWFGAAAAGCTEWHRRVCCAPFVGPQREQHCRKPGFTARPHPCTSQRYCAGLSWSRRGAPRCGRARAWSAVAARRSRCC